MGKIAKYDVLRVGLALATVITIAAPQTTLAFDSCNKELSNENISVKVARETIKGGYTLILTDELKGWIDQKKPLLIVDTMPKQDSYDQEHLPGAVQFEFPIEEMQNMSAQQQAAYSQLLGNDKGRMIVVYCGFPKCGRSHNGAVWAKKLGYTDVIRYVGGIKAWKEVGYPVDKASQ